MIPDYEDLFGYHIGRFWRNMLVRPPVHRSKYTAKRARKLTNVERRERRKQSYMTRRKR